MNKIFLRCLFAGSLIFTLDSRAIEDKKFSIENMEYLGAFKFSNKEFGQSSMNFASGKMALSEDGKSMFVVGHAQQMMIGEFKIPPLIKSNQLSEIAQVDEFKQGFVDVLGKLKKENTQKISGIHGLLEYQNKLIVNGARYYDASATTKHTSFVVEDADNLESSAVHGFYSLEGGAHASGWISPIPTGLTDKLGGTHIAGFASNIPINSRLSIGPSAFSFNLIDLLKSEPGTVKTNGLLDFSLDHPLSNDAYNKTKTNFLWVELSAAIYGFIVPNTSTYAVFGKSGGHKSGIGYKITQDDGQLCPGPCAKEANDNVNYYWLFDVNELINVKQGNEPPYLPRPYEYGIFYSSFENNFDMKTPNSKLISGATFDFNNNILYLMVGGVKRSTRYENTPIVLAYKIKSFLPD
ncbi:hypothetical protein [Paraglaciecola sp.]|uniref:hypothetical protein n=1 Tax=Paraglaciecola sp. TaxID=1920173 RepID=UPI0030F403D4